MSEKEVKSTSSGKGIKVPLFYDPVTDMPSITILFPYVSFIIAIISIIALHFYPQFMVGTSFAVVVWVISTVLYMIRKLHKAKFDLDDKTIEIESEGKD